MSYCTEVSKLLRGQGLGRSFSSEDLDCIKYLYKSAGVKYLEFYDKFGGKSNVQKTNLAKDLLDLEGLRLIFGAKKYLHKVYDDSSLMNVQSKVDLAVKLLDLEGIKYVFKSNNIQLQNGGAVGDYKELVYLSNISNVLNSTQYEVAAKLVPLLNFAIALGDREGISYLSSIVDKQRFEQTLKDNPQLIRQAYRLKKLDIAEKLIEEGAAFDIKYFVFSNASANDKTKYLKHLDNINQKISYKDYLEAQSFVSSLYSMPLLYSKGYNNAQHICSAILNNTYTDISDYVALDDIRDTCIHYSKNHTSVQDVLNFIGLNLHQYNNTKIFIPLKATYVSAHHSTFSIEDPYKESHVYSYYCTHNGTEISDYSSALMHEMSHLFFEKLENNSAIPYSENDIKNNSTEYVSYRSAAEKTVCNVSMFISKRTGSSPQCTVDLSQMIMTLKQHALLFLNFWALEYKHYGKENPKISADLIAAYEPSLKAQHVLHQDQDVSSLTQTDKNVLLLQIFQKYNLSGDESYFLFRIFDFVMRSGGFDEYEKELLVRLPELYVKGLDNSTMSYLYPLEEFWNTYKTPKVNNAVNDYMKECKKIGSLCLFDNTKFDHRHDDFQENHFITSGHYLCFFTDNCLSITVYEDL